MVRRVEIGKGKTGRETSAEHDMGRPQYILDVELTNRCNARCRICPRGELERPLGDMPATIFNALMERILEYNIEHVVVSGFGEPLLHPMLPNYIGALRRAFKGRIQVNTNAMGLNRQLSAQLVEAGLDALNVSYNGPEIEDYEWVMRGARFRTLKRALEQFLEERGKRKAPLLSLQSSMPGVEKQKRKIRKVASELDVEVVRLYGFNNRAGYLACETKAEPVPLRDRFCYDKLMIAWDGTIYPCSHDIKGAHRLGSILEAGFAEIAKEDYPMCAKCTVCDKEGNKRYKIWKNVLRHKMRRLLP